MYVRRNGLVKPCCFARDSAPALGNIARTGRKTSGAAGRSGRCGIRSFRASIPNTPASRAFAAASGRKPTSSASEFATTSSGPGTVAHRSARAPLTMFRRRVLSLPGIVTRLPATAHPAEAHVDVVLPVHNAGRDLESCLQSIARHTSHLYRLILIDDGSTDEGIAGILDRLAESAPEALVIRRPENRGFVATVNEGLALSTAPYAVILNSDTVVTSRWLEKLVAVARSRPDVATVTPLTNNGTICSIPRLNEPQRHPAGLRHRHVCRRLSSTGRCGDFPRHPPASGSAC